MAGVAARTEDLERAAGVLADAAAGLGAASVRLVALAADPGLLATAVVAPLSLAAAEARLAAAVAGATGILPSGARLELTALRLRVVASGYRLAEEGAEQLARGLDNWAGLAAASLAVRLVPLAVPAAPLALLAAVPLRGSLARGPVGAAEQLLAAHALVVQHVVDAVPGTVRQAAGLLLTVRWGSPLLRDSGRVVLATSVRQALPPTGVADLMSGIAACYPEPGAESGTVRVEGVRDADGRRSWVVFIPGTQDWSPLPGGNPFDVTADVASMAGRPSGAGRTVTRSLELAGARPGEPVLLAGHSLGGMIAAGLAADSAFRARFRVTHVVTAGSPVAGYPIPPGVRVLSLEHTDDVVPALDGARNPDRADWVTVSRSISGSATAADPRLAHGVEGYRATAALVDASGDPSLVAWRAGLGPFLRRPGATAVDLVITARRAAS
ncbi:MAG: hypothetical protein ACXV1K_09560 [Kineosporiaceae bacterium]